MDSRRRLGPAPPPSFPGTSARLPGWVSPLFRLSRLAFPGEREWVGGGGSPSGVLFRHRPRCARQRGESGAVPFSPFQRGCLRRGEADVYGEDAWAWPRETERGRREAAPSPGEPPGKESGAQQNGWVWIVVLFFLFVAFVGTKKKAQPFTPLHLHLSGPEAWLQRLGGRRGTGNCLSCTPQPGGWDWFSCCDQGLGSSQNTTKTRFTEPPHPRPNLAPIS